MGKIEAKKLLDKFRELEAAELFEKLIKNPKLANDFHSYFAKEQVRLENNLQKVFHPKAGQTLKVEKVSEDVRTWMLDVITFSKQATSEKLYLLQLLKKCNEEIDQLKKQLAPRRPSKLKRPQPKTRAK